MTRRRVSSVQGFADFFDSLLGGAILVALSIALGGVAFALLVVPRRRRPRPAPRARRCATLIARRRCRASAPASSPRSASRSLLLARATSGPRRSARFLGTLPCRAGPDAAPSLALALAGPRILWRRRRPDAPARWAATALLGGRDRRERRLAGARGRPARATRRADGAHRAAPARGRGVGRRARASWARSGGSAGAIRPWARCGPRCVTRFSWLASARSVGLCAVALPLGWVYVGSWDGLVGTAYGSLVAHQGVPARRRARAGGGQPRRGARLPPAVAASPRCARAFRTSSRRRPSSSSCCSSPPPACRRSRPRATRRPSAPASAEVVEVFRPKLPALRTPSVDTMLQHHRPIRTRPSAASAPTPPTPGPTSATTSPGWCSSP